MLTTLNVTISWCTFLQSGPYYYSTSGSSYSWYQIIGAFIVVFLIAAFFIRFKDGRNATGHWSHPFPDLQMSSQEFYDQIEEIIKGLNEPHIKTRRITYSEGGFISSNRTYLRVSRGDILFDICGAPFGTAFFISWWQADDDLFKRFLLAIPLLGKVFERAFYPNTYYRIDTQDMFQTSIHTILLSAIDALVIAKGLRGLTELERKPTRGKLQPRAVAL